MTQARDTWRQNLLDDLGSDGIDIELTARQLDTALRRTVQMWNRWKPYLKWLSLGDVGAAGTVMFTLTEDQVGVAGVLRVEFADQDYVSGVAYSTIAQRVIMWGRRGPRVFFEMQVSERRMERFTGTQPDWWWDDDDRILYLYVPSRPVRVMALFARPRTLDDIRYDEEYQFEEAALAHAKIIAANILEQAGDTVPGPQGEIGSNAQTWRTEGQDKLREIEEELKNSLLAVAPPQWVG